MPLPHNSTHSFGRKPLDKSSWCRAVLARVFVLTLPIALSACSTYSSPIISDAFDGTNNSEVRALTDLQQMQQELQRLRNAVEELQFQAENAKTRQQGLFADIDRRLLTLERLALPSGQLPTSTLVQPDAAVVGVGNVANANNANNANNAVGTDPTTSQPYDTFSGGTSSAPTENFALSPSDLGQQGASNVSVEEQQQYDLAFELLKQGRYTDAVKAYQVLIDTWPNSQLADDAYFWRAEALYLGREFETALNGFRKLMTLYPDSVRVPEAQLKTGYIQYDMGAYNAAAEIFSDILTRFPSHQVAISAEVRLRRIEQITQ